MLSAVFGLLTGFAEDAHSDSVSHMEASYDESTGVTYTEKLAALMLLPPQAHLAMADSTTFLSTQP